MKLQEFKGYIVDYRLRQFRSQPKNHGIIEFIDFKSEKGDWLLCQMLRAGLVPDDKLDYCL